MGICLLKCTPIYFDSYASHYGLIDLSLVSYNVLILITLCHDPWMAVFELKYAISNVE